MTLRVKQGEYIFSYEAFRLEELRPEQMKAFAGEYYSEELGAIYRIFVKDSRLHLQHKDPHRPYPGGILIPKFKDMYSVQNIILKFGRDVDGRVTGLTVKAGRVKNIRFQKIGSQ